MSKRRVNVSVLPGEPTDGSGRVCVHLFVPDSRGPFTEPHALHPALDEAGAPIKQKLAAAPTRGRLACDARRKRSAAPRRERDGSTTVTSRTDDPRAVTCVNCKASKDYEVMMAHYSAEQQGGGG